MYAELHAYQSAEAKVFADKLLAGSKSRKSSIPKFKKDPDFNEHKILRETIEGHPKPFVARHPVDPFRLGPAGPARRPLAPAPAPFGPRGLTQTNRRDQKVEHEPIGLRPQRTS